MIDPPRAEVKEAVALTKSAGIRTVMITGDHPLTAVEIARQLGISENGQALTGAEIEQMSFDELKAMVERSMSLRASRRSTKSRSSRPCRSAGRSSR